MARLQILELPEGSGDDRPPFILVVDQYEPKEASPEQFLRHQNLAEQIGARAVLVFEDTMDIPANDTTAYLRAGDSRPEFVVELADQDINGTIDAAIQKTKDGPRLAQERTDIARDMDRLANHKAALTDALGIDRLRDWDDIRNAARGHRKERDAQAEALERVRRLHKSVPHRGESICWECSAYDFTGQSTENSPIAYSQCSTLRALNGDTEQSPEE